MPITTTVETNTECSSPYNRNCSVNGVNTYFGGTENEIRLCRQCATQTGVELLVQSCMDGSDVENIFKAIISDLAQRKLSLKNIS